MAELLPPGAELNWQFMSADNFDAGETWVLLQLLAETGSVEEIYVDRDVQKLLHDHALTHDSVPESTLPQWMEYPRPTGTSGALMKHVPGHTDHFHVRFACPKGQSRCKSRD